LAPAGAEAAPKALTAHSVDSLALDELRLAPTLDWDSGFWEHWQPGEAGALEALSVFEDGALRGYREQRDLPDRVGTSRLSPHLHFGEIAPWRIAHALERLRSAGTDADIDGYLRQLGWRDFAYHLLHHFPKTPPTTSTRVSTASLGPRPLQRSCMTGSAATPACRSSMPACASCGTPATCTTGCG
jgi:deoxyribodipyrimidine photolyase